MINQKIDGVRTFTFDSHFDNRGSFTKFFNKSNLNKNNINFEIEEVYCSLSQRGVIRGMHFQVPPYDHSKLIICQSGRVMDVFLDLRLSSVTYGKFGTLELVGNQNVALFLPSGIAHGFQALENESVVLYMVSKEYSQAHDMGIYWDSFGYSWPLEPSNISERDTLFPTLDKFISPFN